MRQTKRQDRRRRVGVHVNTGCTGWEQERPRVTQTTHRDKKKTNEKGGGGNREITITIQTETRKRHTKVRKRKDRGKTSRQRTTDQQKTTPSSLSNDNSHVFHFFFPVSHQKEILLFRLLPLTKET